MMRKKMLGGVAAFILIACSVVASTSIGDDGGPIIYENYRDRSGLVHRAAIYLPPGFSQSREYPAIVICGGWTGSLEGMSPIARHVASWEYIAMVVEPTAESTYVAGILLGGLSSKWVHDVQDGITYLLESSSVKDQVDENRIGLVGHSLGGITATRLMIIDKRIRAVLTLSGVDPLAVRREHPPLLMMTGDYDLEFWDELGILPGYRMALPLKGLIVVRGGTHGGYFDEGVPSLQFGHTTPFGWYDEALFDQSAVFDWYGEAWFDYWLSGEENALDRLFTPLPTLSQFHLSRYDFGEGSENVTPESMCDGSGWADWIEMSLGGSGHRLIERIPQDILLGTIWGIAYVDALLRYIKDYPQTLI